MAQRPVLEQEDLLKTPGRRKLDHNPPGGGSLGSKNTPILDFHVIVPDM